jgi:hypothetical protein
MFLPSGVRWQGAASTMTATTLWAKLVKRDTQYARPGEIRPHVGADREWQQRA